MSSLVDGIKSVWEGIISLPSKIAEAIGSWFEWLFNGIKGLFDGLLNGIKEIFIPDTQELNDIWQDTTDQIAQKFGFLAYDIGSLFKEEKVVQDVTGEYHINGLGTMNVKFMDSNYLVQGVQFFRPFIRGFLALLIVLYHIRQALAFFGLDSGQVQTYGDASRGRDYDS